jgi:hypothetical protein
MDLKISPEASAYIRARGGIAHLVSYQGMSLC